MNADDMNADEISEVILEAYRDGWNAARQRYGPSDEVFNSAVAVHQGRNFALEDDWTKSRSIKLCHVLVDLEEEDDDGQ